MAAAKTDETVQEIERTPWLDEIMSDYENGLASCFLVHGDVFGYAPGEIPQREYIETALGQVATVLTYSPDAGVMFPGKPAEAEANRRRLTEVLTGQKPAPAKVNAPGGGRVKTPEEILKSANTGRGPSSDGLQLPTAPTGAIPALVDFMEKGNPKDNRGKFACVIIDRLDLIAPPADKATLSDSKAALLSLLQRVGTSWEVNKNNAMMILLAPSLEQVHEDLRDPASGLRTIEIELPDHAERKSFAQRIMKKYEVKLDIGVTLDEFAAQTAGLSRRHIEDISLVGRKTDGVVTREGIAARKRQLLSAAYADVLEVMDTDVTMDMVGGHQLVKDFLVKEVINVLLNEKQRDMAPLALLLTGPSGCLHPDTPIFDPVDGTTRSVFTRYLEDRPFHVLSKNSRGDIVIGAASPPDRYTSEQMVRLTTETGEQITVTLGHQFLRGDVWGTAADVVDGVRERGVYGLSFTSEDRVTTYADLLSSQVDGSVAVIKVEEIEAETYYDFHVQEYENYWACGLWNHNTGKTFVARAIANSIKWNCLLFRPEKIKGGIVGESERRLAKAFRGARSMAPCVIFWDEIDQGGRRTEKTAGDGGSAVEANAFNATLEFFGDQKNRGNVLLIAASNRPKLIDAAFLRRLELKIPLLPPLDSEERVDIMNVLLKRHVGWIDPDSSDGLAASLTVADIADQTDGWTQAELEKLVITSKRVMVLDEKTRSEALIIAKGRLIAATQEVDEMVQEALSVTEDLIVVPERWRSVVRQEEEPEDEAPRGERRRRSVGL